MKRLELLEALKNVMPGVEEKNTLLQGADSFMFDGKWIKTFNNEISASYPFDSGIKCLVKAQEFYKILSLIDTDEIKMTMLSDGKLQLAGGKTVLRMVSIDSSSIRELVDNLSIDSIKWNKLPKDFIKALDVTSGYATNNKAYPSLCGISLGRDGLVATDKIRAGFYSLEFRSLKKEVLLPIGAANNLVKFDDLEEFSVADSWIHFRTKKGLQFSTRKVDVEFPRQGIKNLLTFEDVDKTVYSFPVNLTNSINKASVFSFSDDSGAVYIELSVKENGNLIVSGAKQYGDVEDFYEPDGKWSFPKGVTLKIMPKMLSDLLSLGNEFYVKEERYLLARFGTFDCIISLVV